VLERLRSSGWPNLVGEETPDQTLSSTLMRGLDILGLFSDRETSLTNAEIARRLDLNRATVSRLCKTLVHTGFLRRAARGGFQLAPRILALSYPLLATTRWRHEMTAPMRELAEMSGGNVTLAAISGTRFVQLQALGNPAGFPHVPEPGISGPLHLAASGRALLSLLSDAALSDMFATLHFDDPEGFDAHAQDTVEAIERCRTEGFCSAYGGWRPSIAALSAPIGISPDGLEIALSCGTPRYRARPDEMESDLGPRMAEAARTLRETGQFISPHER